MANTSSSAENADFTERYARIVHLAAWLGPRLARDNIEPDARHLAAYYGLQDMVGRSPTDPGGIAPDIRQGWVVTNSTRMSRMEGVSDRLHYATILLPKGALALILGMDSADRSRPSRSAATAMYVYELSESVLQQEDERLVELGTEPEGHPLYSGTTEDALNNRLDHLGLRSAYEEHVRSGQADA